MIIFYAVILLLMPVMMIVLGLIYQKTPQKKMTYGYRTAWSMKSYETWIFAHKYSGIIWLYSGLTLMTVSLIALFICRDYNKDMLSVIVIIITFVQLLGLCLPIIPTEQALKKHFDANGKIK